MENNFILPHVTPSTEQRNSVLKGISSAVHPRQEERATEASQEPLLLRILMVAVAAEPSFEVHTTMSTRSRDAESLLTTGSIVSPTSAERAQSNTRK